ncbi:MAG: Na(+)-translocating NADH-quinone reductase subunit A [Chitinophagaceae bacterium]|nr:Na(+)-translocating NADH-quinone reductase subunit A [Chitinophagaceae bacterium]
MPKHIKIRKGLNINLAGEAEKVVSDFALPETFAIKPPDFIGVTPKLLVKQGDEVEAGTPIFYDKNNEGVKFCSPVSGEVIEVMRGDKRKILEIKILADKEIIYMPFEKADLQNQDRDDVMKTLLNSGAWPFIRQRPYGIIANPDQIPKAIFISAFDTSPLAPDYDFIMQGQDMDFQTGIDALQKLTDGKIYLNLNGAKEQAPVFTKAKGVDINYFSGPHPAGNAGVHIHHLNPVNKGETVWCINPQDVLIIGRLFNHGKFDASRMVALTGSHITSPQYYKTLVGSAVSHIIEDGGIKDGINRIISGNVLSGHQIEQTGYMNFFDDQLTIIPEGNEPEFMGWLAPGLKKFSASRTFFSWITPTKKYFVDTNLHGEERPFVVSGEYEKVFPMDIYPVQLLKAIMIEDLELMENLGIYEVVEEDFALCEFICTSKIPSQSIIRHGLELARKEFS